MSECPVCGKGGVDKAASHCPQCDADLECFALLETLHEGEPLSAPGSSAREPSSQLQSNSSVRERSEAVRGERNARWGARWFVSAVGLALSLLFAVLVLQLLALRQPNTDPAIAAQAWEPDVTAAALRTMVTKIDRLSGRLASIEGRLGALDAMQAKTLEQATTVGRQLAEVGQASREASQRLGATDAEGENQSQSQSQSWPVLHHHLRPGETLWSIAQRYYGHGWLFPVLIAQNPGLGVYHQGAGMLRLFADPARAHALYRQITPPGAERRLFRYQVQPGDDWSELARRFLGRAQRAPELRALNPGSVLAPESLILIPLE